MRERERNKERMRGGGRNEEGKRKDAPINVDPISVKNSVDPDTADNLLRLRRAVAFACVRKLHYFANESRFALSRERYLSH